MMESAVRDDDHSESVAVDEDTPAVDDDGSSPDDVIFNTILSQSDANPTPVVITGITCYAFSSHRN